MLQNRVVTFYTKDTAANNNMEGAFLETLKAIQLL